MIFPILLIVVALAIAALYAWLRKEPSRGRRWRLALGLGLGIGLARGALASTGWYIVERTGGPLQVPAFALAMLAWPEAALVGDRRVTPVPLAFYLQLVLTLVGGTLVLASLVAAAVDLTDAPADRQ